MSIYDIHAKFPPVPSNSPRSAAEVFFLVYFAQSVAKPDSFEVINRETGETNDFPAREFVSHLPVWDLDSIAASLRKASNLLVEDSFELDGSSVLLGRIGEGVIRVGDTLRGLVGDNVYSAVVRNIHLLGKEVDVGYLGETVGVCVDRNVGSVFTAGTLLVGSA